MADTLFTRALVRAAEIEGSTQALASLLHVPESTLLRWMVGRAQMPLQAFLRLIEIVSEDERKQAPKVRPGSPEAQALRFRIGELEAHCSRCDGTEFIQSDPAQALRYINELVCCACGEPVVHGNLIARLAKDAVQHAKTLTVVREKRQVELLRKSPKLRALKESSRSS